MDEGEEWSGDATALSRSSSSSTPFTKHEVIAPPCRGGGRYGWREGRMGKSGSFAYVLLAYAVLGRAAVCSFWKSLITG